MPITLKVKPRKIDPYCRNCQLWEEVELPPLLKGRNLRRCAKPRAGHYTPPDSTCGAFKPKNEK